MSEPEIQFSIERYKLLLEAVHDARQDLSEKSVENGNNAMIKLSDYLEKSHPNRQDFILIKSLLHHPKRGVRYLAATTLLDHGDADGWPALIEAATPIYRPSDDTPGEHWRNFYAGTFARLYIMMNQQKLEDLHLSPTLDEVEDRWIAESLTDRKMPRFKIPKLPPKPQ